MDSIGEEERERKRTEEAETEHGGQRKVLERTMMYRNRHENQKPVKLSRIKKLCTRVTTDAISALRTARPHMNKMEGR